MLGIFTVVTLFYSHRGNKTEKIYIQMLVNTQAASHTHLPKHRSSKLIIVRIGHIDLNILTSVLQVLDTDLNVNIQDFICL